MVAAVHFLSVEQLQTHTVTLKSSRPSA